MSDPGPDPRAGDSGGGDGDEITSLARKALDVLVFAPAGLVLTAVEDLPKVVAKGRSHLELRIRNARFVGQMVVGRGHHELRHRWEQLADRPDAPAPEDAAATGSYPEPLDDPDAPGARGYVGDEVGASPLAPAPNAIGGSIPDAVTSGDEEVRQHPDFDLEDATPSQRDISVGAARPGVDASEVDAAIPGYDTLSASHVVRRLDGLGRHELDAVGRYESSTRGRRTILNRVQQLLNAEAPPTGQG